MMIEISEENLNYILSLARERAVFPFQIYKLTPEEFLEKKMDTEMAIIETNLVVKLDAALTCVEKLEEYVKELEDIIRSQSVWKLIKLKVKIKIGKLREWFKRWRS